MLARLQHPGIAQIYEAGAADAGFGPQPYFAMEFIRGEPLRDVRAARAALDDARAAGAHGQDLRRRAARAPARRHPPRPQAGQHPGRPERASRRSSTSAWRALTDSDAQATRQTDVGQLIGTLAYMSPEQVLADPLELDTRSDVYALGVILYELLAGRLPYHLISNLLHEAVRTIREEEPDAAELDRPRCTAATSRPSSPRRWRRTRRGAIASAAELAARHPALPVGRADRGAAGERYAISCRSSRGGTRRSSLPRSWSSRRWLVASC